MERANKVSLFDTVVTLLEQRRYATIRDILNTMNPVDIAALFEDLQSEKTALLFRLLPKETAAETFVEMDEETQELLIHGFSDTELKEIIDELYVDDAVDLIEEMPANVVKRILRSADPQTRKEINEILKYPEDSAGSIMTTEFVALRPKMTVEEAIKRIRRTGIDKETIYTCYVTDNSSTLIGIVTIKTMLLSEEDESIENLMETHVIAVNTLDDQEVVAQMFNKYNFLALPVVDKENRLVGIVTVDDAIDVLEEEATEDIQKMAAITPTTDKPYDRVGVFATYLSRIPWLLILMVSATFTGMIITGYEDALAASSAVFLTAFIPMLMDTGGNSGSQASVTIIRALSLGEIEFKDIFKVIFKECRVALLCGVTLAAANFAKLMLFDRLVLGNQHINFVVAFTVCITMVVTILIAKFVGCTLPMLAKKIGFDPAVMASPFITTIVDAISLIVYFAFATAILHI